MRVCERERVGVRVYGWVVECVGEWCVCEIYIYIYIYLTQHRERQNIEDFAHDFRSRFAHSHTEIIEILEVSLVQQVADHFQVSFSEIRKLRASLAEILACDNAA